jgi:alpha-galactosidase
VLELSNSLSIDDASTWQKYANGWRIDGDIEDYGGEHGSSYPLTDWSNVTSRFRDLPKWVQYAGPGGWNDLDSLEVGNGTNDGLTVAQRQSTMTLWAISCAPLLLGTDLTHLDPTDLGMLTNSEVIAVDQAGVPASLIGGEPTSEQQVWSAKEPGGSYAVALFNLSTTATVTVSVSWHQLGFSGSASVRDLWSHTNLGSFATGFSASLAPGASRLITVKP